MQKYLKNNLNQILLIFLYLQPVIDLITSLSLNIFHLNLTLGIITRFVFLLFIFYYVFFIKRNLKKPDFIILGLVLLYYLAFSIMIIFYKDPSALVYELTNISKAFYFPILLLLLNKLELKINQKDFFNLGLIYLFFIAIPTIFGLSFNSYTQGKVGSVGWFNSGNEISAIISILTPFLLSYFFTKHNLINKILLFILISYTYFIIGSKIAIFVLLISLVYNFFLYFKEKSLKKYTKQIILGIVLALIIGAIYLPKTNFYYNLIIHLNYLGITSYKDIFTYNFLNRFIFSDRLTYLANTNLNYIWSKPLEKYLGLGFIELFGTDYVSLKMIEMDFFDLFYRLGIIGFITYFIPIISIIIANHNRSSYKNKSYHLTSLSLIIGFILALIVGHTLLAPAVSIYLIYIYLYRKEIII